ncbi:MAG: GldG family protein [Acidobacteriota bacterium]|nr:GldG family protein [Acidobacteriota bacterium]
MKTRKKRMASLGLTVLLTVVNLVAFNYLISGWSAARLDLTQDRLFSISGATRNVLGSLEEDLTIYGYFSERTHPKLAPLVPQIVDLLEEYRAMADGRLTLEVVDPSGDSDVEAMAADRFGVRSTPFQLASKYETGIVNAYFAIVIQYGDQYERYGFQDLITVEPTADGDIDISLRNLEYDVTRAIKKVVYGFHATADLFDRLDQPVRFTAVMTPSDLPEVLAETPETVRAAVAEIAPRAGQMFVYEELDPSQDPALGQELADRYGMAPMSMGLFSEGSFYLYGLLEIDGRIEQLMLTEPDLTVATVREQIEEAIQRSLPGFLTTVGVVAPKPLDIPPQLQMQMQMQQPPPEFEQVTRYLGQDYEVAEVALADPVPRNVDLLLVLKPNGLTRGALYNLDQYLMRGGRVVLCAGTYEADFDQSGLRVQPVETGLEDWLQHHGVTLTPTLVLDDRNQSLPIPEVQYTSLGAIRTWGLAPYPYLVQVREDGFLNRDITATLDSVGIYWGSPIEVDLDREDVDVLPILQSSDASWIDDDLTKVALLEYTVPEEGTQPHLLSVALNGRFTSYFAERPVREGDDEPAITEEIDLPTPGDDGSLPAPPEIPLKQSPETRLVVVGNSEFLSDFVAGVLGQVDGGFFAENLRFTKNIIDWATLDNDMIDIRAKGSVSRRLEPIDDGRRKTLEAINYLLPLLALVGLATWRRLGGKR